ncbi:MAG: hypothetical protein ACE5GO_09795 [Anaerolineales bacterium]
MGAPGSVCRDAVGDSVAGGAGPWLLTNLAPSLNNLLRAIAMVFGISIAVHLALVLPVAVAVVEGRIPVFTLDTNKKQACTECPIVPVGQLKTQKTGVRRAS